MSAKQARTRFGVMALLSLLLGAAFYFLLHLPQQAELQAKEAEAARLLQEAAEASAFRRAHPDPAKEAKALGERKRRIDEMFPTRLAESAFLTETEKRAAEAGVVLLGVAPGEAESRDGVTRSSIRLSVRGDYFALMDYLYSLEQRGRFVKIDAVRGKADNVGTFTGTIELWIYARKI